MNRSESGMANDAIGRGGVVSFGVAVASFVAAFALTYAVGRTELVTGVLRDLKTEAAILFLLGIVWFLAGVMSGVALRSRSSHGFWCCARLSLLGSVASSICATIAILIYIRAGLLEVLGSMLITPLLAPYGLVNFLGCLLGFSTVEALLEQKARFLSLRGEILPPYNADQNGGAA